MKKKNKTDIDFKKKYTYDERETSIEITTGLQV